ncbi:MAG TPA: VacJ family lipoprotein [Caulobacteraceae bacterium]|nr:VacJ family lipoprotein [Caulobacteraceae bacterium]
MRPRRLFTLLGFGLAVVGSSAHAQTPEDPYEAINRQSYARQTDVAEKYLKPLAQLYQRLTPGPLGVAIHNLVTELSEPVIIINDILQARFRSAGKDLVRLTANASFGLGGTVDVATKHGLPHHDNDFGITLGVWGVKPGPYLFLPFVGPTTVRDVIGIGADAGMNPFNFVRFPGRQTLLITSAVVGGLDKLANTQADLEAITSGAADPYATLRSVYLQNREAQIRGEEATPVLPPLDEPGAPAAAPAPSAAADPPAAALATSAGQAPLAARAAAGAAADPYVIADLDAPIATAQPVDLDRSAMRLAAAH